MNTRIILIPFFIFLMGLMECVYATPDTTIYIKTIAGMQYDVVRFQVRPGSEVKLVLTNTDDMSHNLVITKPESRLKVVEKSMALAERGPDLEFIPEIPEVKWSIPVLSPGEEKSIHFTVPDQKTVLPYVCTFPGHGYIMYGAIYVQNEKMPPLEEDENIPEFRRKHDSMKDNDMDHQMMQTHPYQLDPPYYYRIFMPRASPASIAVRLTDNISFCWDAGPCQLLYAWKGGFIDNSVAWKGHKNTESEILGQIFYEEPVNNPLMIGEKTTSPDKIEFKGYRLVDRNPEFHYVINGVDVYESFKVEGDQLIRTFRIPDAPNEIRIGIDPSVTPSHGHIRNDVLVVKPEHAQQFLLAIPIKEPK